MVPLDITSWEATNRLCCAKDMKNGTKPLWGVLVIGLLLVGAFGFLRCGWVPSGNAVKKGTPTRAGPQKGLNTAGGQQDRRMSGRYDLDPNGARRIRSLMNLEEGEVAMAGLRIAEDGIGFRKLKTSGKTSRLGTCILSVLDRSEFVKVAESVESRLNLTSPRVFDVARTSSDDALYGNEVMASIQSVTSNDHGTVLSLQVMERANTDDDGDPVIGMGEVLIPRGSVLFVHSNIDEEPGILIFTSEH